MQYPSIRAPQGALWLLFLAVSPASAPAQVGYHVDTRVGFKFRLPLKWKAWPVEKDRRQVTAHYVQIQDWPIPRSERSHRPSLRVLVLPRTAAGGGPGAPAANSGKGPVAGAAEAGDAKAGGAKAGGAAAAAWPFPVEAVDRYADYADYLTRNVSGTLKVETGKTGRVDELPYRQLVIERRVDELKYEMTTWIVALEAHTVAIEFTVLEMYAARLRERLVGCFRSFRRVPVENGADADPWAPPLWIRDPVRWRGIDRKTRIAQRSAYEEAFVRRVESELSPGFRLKPSKRFLLVSNADSARTAQIGKAADACLECCEDHFDRISDDPVIKAVIRVFDDRADYELYRSRSRRTSHYVPGIREIIVPPSRRRPNEMFGLDDLTEGVLHYFLADKDQDLFRNLPHWLREGLEGYLRSSRLQRSKLVFEIGDGERGSIRSARRRKKLETPKALVGNPDAAGRLDRQLRDQRVHLVRFALESGRGQKGALPAGFLADYLVAVRAAPAGFGLPPERPGAGRTPGMSDALRGKRDAEVLRRREELLKAVNRAACPWDEVRWAALNEAWVKFDQKQ